MALDYNAMAEALDEVREGLNAMVAALVTDGFTDAQARDIIASMWVIQARGDEEDEGDG